MANPLKRSQEAARGPRRKILLVDDDPLVLDCCTAILSASFFEVICAADGEEAVGKFKANLDALSLVIMDIAMPRMDGVKAAQQMRELDYSAKIILISGFTSQPLSALVADAFLAKPFRGKDLLKVVRRVLQEETLQDPWDLERSPLPEFGDV